MIKFDAFINAIHSAILSANDVLMDKNLEVLETYFEEAEDSDEFQSELDKALASINDVLGTDRQSITRQKITTMVASLQKVRDSLSQPKSEADQNKAILPSQNRLKPKMTILQFPHKTANGIVMSDVNVPLITLVPLSMTQISEVKFNTELEIQIENDELLVSFHSAQSQIPNSTENEPRNTSHASLQITLTPHHGTEGLRKIVEGYEKILRAQIPH